MRLQPRDLRAGRCAGVDVGAFAALTGTNFFAAEVDEATPLIRPDVGVSGRGGDPPRSLLVVARAWPLVGGAVGPSRIADERSAYWMSIAAWNCEDMGPIDIGDR
jgi:hypothetical protein